MTKLTTKARDKIATKNFALPGRRYPIEDASHARNALARVSQHGTPSEKATVEAKVHAKYPGIGEGGEGTKVGHAEHHKKGGPNEHHKFDAPQLKGCFLAEHHRAVDGYNRTPDRFKGTSGSGLLRVSGKSGAHQIGKRK